MQLAVELPFKQMSPQQLFCTKDRLFMAQNQFLYEYDQITGDITKCGKLPQNVGVFSIADRHFIQIYGGASRYELYAMHVCPEFLSTSEEFVLSPLTDSKSLQFQLVAVLDSCLQCFQPQLSADFQRAFDFVLPGVDEPPANAPSTEIQTFPEFQATLGGCCAQRANKRFLAQIARLVLEAACDTRYEDLSWAEKRLVAEQSRGTREYSIEARQYAERFSRELAAKRAEDATAAYDTPATYI